MRAFTTVELLRDLPSVTAAVARGPVTITRHRKPRYVLMAMEDYARLGGNADPRRAYETATLPDDLRAELATIAELDADGA